MAAHESPRTTKLYDRTQERLTQDEVENTALAVRDQSASKGVSCRMERAGSPGRGYVPQHSIGPLVEAKIFTQ